MAKKDRIPVKAHTRGKKMPPPPPAPSMLAPAPGETNENFPPSGAPAPGGMPDQDMGQ